MWESEKYCPFESQLEGAQNIQIRFENVMMRIAIFDHNKFKLSDRGLCWKAVATFVDEINEKGFNVNSKMKSKQINNFQKLEPISLCRTCPREDFILIL